MYTVNQRLHASVELLAGIWPHMLPTSSLGAYAIRVPSHVDHEKIVAWISISMHARSSVPTVMGLRLAAHRAP